MKQHSCKICEAKLIELKEEIDKTTIIGGDFNILFSTTDRKTRQKNSKHITQHQ